MKPFQTFFAVGFLSLTALPTVANADSYYLDQVIRGIVTQSIDQHVWGRGEYQRPGYYRYHRHERRSIRPYARDDDDDDGPRRGRRYRDDDDD